VPEIKEITSIATSQIYTIRKTAFAQGYDPKTNKKLLLSYVKDAPRSSRPSKVTDEIQQQITEVVNKNSTTQQMTTQAIANKINELAAATATDIKISAHTIYNILISLGYSSYKPTYKPGLTLEAKAL
jgi:transposase